MDETRDSKMAVMASRSPFVRWVSGLTLGAFGSLARSLRILNHIVRTLSSYAEKSRRRVERVLRLQLTLSGILPPDAIHGKV